MDDYLEAMGGDMTGALESLQKELGKVRTGRATPKLVDGVMVHVHSYGSTLPLNQLATIQAPDARLITITPWDKSTIGDIEKAILAASLGLNPSSDGQIVRVPVPPLTQERRQALVKTVRASGEDSKVRMRQIRREYNDIFRAGEKDGEISEDDCRRLLDRVQQVTDEYIAKVDKLLAAKEAEVLEV
jgi:ribosome recycling factor